MGEERPDLFLFISIVILLAVGIVMIYSASSIRSLLEYQDSFFYLRKQVSWALLGMGILLLSIRVNYHFYRRWSKLLMFITLILLVLVLFPGIGVMRGGSRRWLGLGDFLFQPSELAKISLVIYLALYLSEKKERIYRFNGIIPPLLISSSVAVLIVLEPDLGTAITVMGTCFVILFAAGIRISHLLGLSLLGLPLLGYFIMAEEYRRSRLFSFLNPWADPLDTGFQIIQSLFALGSGGLLGLGLGMSRQKFFYLPEPGTDFIFAILGEELGFFGTSLIVLLFFFFAWRGLRIALGAPDLFGSILALGVTTMIVFQALINIGVVTGSMPVTGITLPFISYGGSSLVITLFGVGILLNISTHCTGLDL